MIDQPSPPFRTGDVAYTQPAPGGYASAAAVPTDPAFSGNDAAYTVPSLGGEFQPGSGQAAPTNSPISKGADADGGAQDIADAPRVDEPAPPAPQPPDEIAVEVSDLDLIFTGVASADMDVTVTFEVNDDGVVRNVVCPILEGDSAGVVAAKVAQRMNEATYTTGTTTSNQVRLGTKTPNVFGEDPVTCVIA
jgi:hypothetical protein